MPTPAGREYLNAILSVPRTGCAWRHLPSDFTARWSATHKHFLHWCRAGIWARVLTLSQIARLLRRRDRSLLSETL